MTSLIKVKYCSYLSFSDTYFFENFLYEPELNTKRAMILYLDSFYGQLLFKESENLSINNHYGLHSDFVLNDLGI